MAPYPILRRTLVPFLRWRVAVNGLEHLPTTGPYILAPNHQSYLDPPLVWLAIVPATKRKLYFITKEYVWRGLKKIFRQRGINWIGLLPIYSHDKAAVLDAAIARLKAGDPVVIFPEGTRNRLAETVLLKGKTGVARLALATGAPVIPAGITAPPGLTRTQAIRNFFSFHPARLQIGTPLHFAAQTEYSKEDLERVTTQVMQAIGKLCNKEYRP